MESFAHSESVDLLGSELLSSRRAEKGVVFDCKYNEVGNDAEERILIEVEGVGLSR